MLPQFILNIFLIIQIYDNSAIICYETFLRYYVMCLRYAGSYYAFHTIGSAMACDHGCTSRLKE